MLQHVNVERLIGNNAFQAGVLTLELLQSLYVLGFHPAVLGQPAGPRGLGDPELAAHLLQSQSGSDRIDLGPISGAHVTPAVEMATDSEFVEGLSSSTMCVTNFSQIL